MHNNEEYKFSKEQKSEADKKMEAQGIPVYMERLELSDEQKKRLVEEIFAEFKVLKEEREAKHLEKKWQALDNQYDGKLNEDTRRQFNLNKGVTKVKIDKIVRYAKQAFFESDPVFAITPRPEFYKNSGLEVCSKQQDFLDYKMDNLPFEQEIDLVFHSAAVKGTGILKIFHDIRREPRRREERYEAKIVSVIDPINKQPVVMNGQQVLENRGLKEFLSNWPSAAEKYPGYLKQLASGKDIEFVVDYKETVYNDPRPKFIDLKDFYVRINTNGYDGLKTTRLTVERQNYTYWDLRREEKEEKFYDIDKLISDEKEKDGKKKNYENLDFDILECVYYFRLNDNDSEETKIVVWVDEDKKIVIGSVLYQYYAIGSCYIPFYIKRKKTGFYQPGVAEDLTDNNLAENAILNLTLESSHITNTVTPITNKPEVMSQFLEKRFAHGVPIEAKAGEIDFLQKYMRPTDVGGLIQILLMLSQFDDDLSGVSAGMSGKENPLDPQAPASKTIALLKASSIDINDYIRHLISSFNEIGYILLAMYYQMSKEGRKYTIRPENVVGENPFGVLERNDMIARTNIQARAYAYDFDKVNEKAQDLALYQTIRTEPLVAKNPEAVYTLLKNIIENWSIKWKNIATKVIPSLEDFKKMQLQTAMQGVAMYIQGVLKNSKVTGVEPEFDVKAMLPMLADMQAMMVTPPAPEVQKQQEKAQ